MNTMTAETRARPLLAKIRRHFPRLTWQTYRYNDQGWDHEVIVLDEHLVFRFPNDQDYAADLKDVITTLKLLKPRLVAAIPDYTYVAKDGQFAGYRMIPGQQVSRQVYDGMPSPDRLALTQQLADFLSALHRLPLDPNSIGSVHGSYLAEDQAHVKTRMPQIKPRLTLPDYRMAQRMLANTDQLLLKSLPTVLLHNDISSTHILWDESAGKLGIIDFSDRCLGDPAVDFAELFEYGAAFVQEVYRLYRGPKDDTFLERAWQYQQWVGVYILADYFDNHKIPFETARQTFDRVKAGPHN